MPGVGVSKSMLRVTVSKSMLGVAVSKSISGFRSAVTVRH